MRIGAGTLRLPDGEAAVATIHAALDAGLRLFDTARAYPSETLLGAALAAHPLGAEALIVTKGGMSRADGQWRPDGRATSLRRDCEASRLALGRPIDLYLVHAPDPRVKWSTTVRALGRFADEKLVRAVGVCNVSLAQLDEALALAPITAVQVALNLLDDLPLRSGVLERCRERGLLLMAHSPLGGPRRKNALLSAAPIVELARRRAVSPAALALGALLDAHPQVLAIPGVSGAESARQVAQAMELSLDDDERALLAAQFPSLRRRAMVPAAGAAEVVLVMGLPGAGKSALAQALEGDGYERLNRDTLGGSLARVASLLEERLAAGARRLVLDNTYLTRAARAQVLAAAQGAAVRGLFIDVPLVEAQVNIVSRMLDAHGRLLSGGELRGGNTSLSPTSLWRLARTLEVPVAGEGFTSLEVRPFARTPRPGRPARFIALGLVDRLAAELPGSFVVGWAPDAPPDCEDRLAARSAGVALCRHRGGPPICWCRPPLPGLLLALARSHGLDVAASELHGESAAHRALAVAVGARFIHHGA